MQIFEPIIHATQSGTIITTNAPFRDSSPIDHIGPKSEPTESSRFIQFDTIVCELCDTPRELFIGQGTLLDASIQNIVSNRPFYWGHLWVSPEMQWAPVGS